jgi:hypothetical protein
MINDNDDDDDSERFVSEIPVPAEGAEEGAE